MRKGPGPTRSRALPRAQGCQGPVVTGPTSVRRMVVGRPGDGPWEEGVGGEAPLSVGPESGAARWPNCRSRPRVGRVEVVRRWERDPEAPAGPEDPPVGRVERGGLRQRVERAGRPGGLGSLVAGSVPEEAPDTPRDAQECGRSA
ncbi:hypothetical protein GCM10010282_23210 [Streptomyces roseolus]|nr:hypothetical protein GCM10010282_23210 [Streptomyces roseolus]